MLNHNILKLSSMIFALTINFISSFHIFPYTVAEISSMYPTPITPASFTFSIWGIIYLQWIFAIVKEKDSLQILDYLLNALWIILWCNNLILLACLTLLLMTFRVLLQLPTQSLYASWLCVASCINAYIVGGSVLAIFFIVFFILFVQPMPALHNRMRIAIALYKDKKNPLAAFIPTVISLLVFSWAFLGILLK
ncbi:MAG: hypothetical protein ACRCV3_05680 [Desulfovibrionaceae bacterium]